MLNRSLIVASIAAAAIGGCLGGLTIPALGAFIDSTNINTVGKRRHYTRGKRKYELRQRWLKLSYKSKTVAERRKYARLVAQL
jgi:hypothetical protein